MDAVLDGGSDGPRDEAGMGIGQRKGVIFGANLGRAIVTNGDFAVYLCERAYLMWSTSVQKVRNLPLLGI